MVFRRLDVPSSHVVTRTFRKPYRYCISFGFVPNIPHAKILNVHPTIFCFRVLGLFSSFGFVSNIPRTHRDFFIPSFGFVLEFWVYFEHSTYTHTHTMMLYAHPTIFLFQVLGSFRILHTHHDALRLSHDFLFPSFGFKLTRF